MYPPKSVHKPTTVHQHGLSSDKICTICGQKRDHTNDILRLPKTAQRGAAYVVLCYISTNEGSRCFGLGKTYSDNIDTYPEGSKLHCKSPCDTY